MTTERLEAPNNPLRLPVHPHTDCPDDYSAFGMSQYYGEIISMLRFRFQDDTWRCLPYYSLLSLNFDPNLGIELTFPNAHVSIRGRNLFDLFSKIGDHGVRWVWEASRAEYLQADESAPVIESIEFGIPKNRA